MEIPLLKICGFLRQTLQIVCPIYAPFRTKRKTSNPKTSGLIMFLSYECSCSII